MRATDKKADWTSFVLGAVLILWASLTDGSQILVAFVGGLLLGRSDVDWTYMVVFFAAALALTWAL